VRIHATPLALFLTAGLLYWGAGLPAWRDAARAEAERAKVASESEGLRTRVERAERQRAAEESVRRASPRSASGDPVVALRRSLLETLKGAPVEDVRLTVAPAASPLAARATLSADGRFEDLAKLSERLLGPDGGLLPEELQWRPKDAGATLDLRAVALPGTP